MAQFKQSCIFCGGHGKLTKEHLFGQWLKKHVGGYSNETDHQVRFVAQAETRTWGEPEKGRLHKKRPPFLSNMRLVCLSCNGGWMSRLQETAKPTLLDVMAGEWTHMGPSEGLVVSAWAAMVCMCLEFAEPKTIATTSEVRREFSQTSRPPDRWSIYAGRCDGVRDVGTFWHRGAHLFGDSSQPTSACNVQTTLFYFGRTFFLIIGVGSSSMAPPDDDFANYIGLRQLWPVPTPVGKMPLVYTHAGVIRTAVAFWEAFGEVDIPAWSPQPTLPPIVFRPK